MDRSTYFCFEDRYEKIFRDNGGGWSMSGEDSRRVGAVPDILVAKDGTPTNRYVPFLQ